MLKLNDIDPDDDSSSSFKRLKNFNNSTLIDKSSPSRTLLQQNLFKNSAIKDLPQFVLSPRKSLISQKLARFVVPGIFLLMLGLGNLAVGTYKGSEYREVLREISIISPESSNISSDTSALKRIQLTKNKNHRLEHRRQNARARIDFYNLVSFGGKLMLSISSIVLITAFFFGRSKR